MVLYHRQYFRGPQNNYVDPNPRTIDVPNNDDDIVENDWNDVSLGVDPNFEYNLFTYDCIT